MKEFLKALTQALAPSGHEGSVRDLIINEVSQLADDLSVDALGNLILHKKPAIQSASSKKIMLAAHMDEIGVIASHIDSKGFVRFASVGGAFARYALGARVRFLSGVSGVVGYDRLEQMDHHPALNKMYIDVGATSTEDCPVRVGDIAAFEGSFFETGTRFVAKAMDNRAGVLVLVETLRALQSSPHHLFFVFSTQEEVGMRGVGAAAYRIDPEIGIAVDTTPTGDTPASIQMVMELGKGPCVKLRDVGMVSDLRVANWMIQTAEKQKIPYQREVLLVGSTDARQIQTSRSGVLSGALSIPCRYTHSTAEMVDAADLKNSIALLKAMLEAPL